VQKYTTSSIGQRTYTASCVSIQPEIEYALLGVEFLLLFICIGLIWATSKAPKKVNETDSNLRINALRKKYNPEAFQFVSTLPLPSV
jgi:hypothetical protein